MTLDQQVRFQLFRDGAAAHVRLAGPINRDTAPAFQALLHEALDGEPTVLSLDLGAAEYLDSDGVRWLQRLQEELSARGVTLRLALREGCRAERTLQLVRLDSAFPIDRYPAEAALPRSTARR